MYSFTLLLLWWTGDLWRCWMILHWSQISSLVNLESYRIGLQRSPVLQTNNWQRTHFRKQITILIFDQTDFFSVYKRTSFVTKYHFILQAQSPNKWLFSDSYQTWVQCTRTQWFLHCWTRMSLVWSTRTQFQKSQQFYTIFLTSVHL